MFSDNPVGVLERAVRLTRILLQRLHQIPEISAEVPEHRDGAVRLLPERTHELDAPGAVSLVVALEIVGVQEEEDAPARLGADARQLLGRGGPREQQARLARARRRYDHPALRLLRGLGVLDELEAELADVERERLVVVADDEANEARCCFTPASSPSACRRRPAARTGIRRCREVP